MASRILKHWPQEATDCGECFSLYYVCMYGLPSVSPITMSLFSYSNYIYIYIPSKTKTIQHTGDKS